LVSLFFLRLYDGCKFTPLIRCAIRQHKLKQIEQEYSDFIEDQRELEGRLFFRWHSSVLLTIRSPDQIASARMESTEGNDPEHLKSRPTGSHQ
jgi:hypothetical protein